MTAQNKDNSTLLEQNKERGDKWIEKLRDKRAKIANQIFRNYPS